MACGVPRPRKSGRAANATSSNEIDRKQTRGWRRELFGEKALALKHGRLALAVENGRVVTVEKS